MNSILAIGLNHKVAPIHARERLAFSAERVPLALRELTGDESIHEAVLLSTCNRTEVYVYASDAERAEFALRDFFARYSSLPAQELNRTTYLLRGMDAANHLLTVAAGLDSLVLGENEILGQVRSASEIAQQAGAIGAHLSALFRYAIQAGKRARTETEVGRANISVAGVVVEIAEKTFGSLNERTALLIGAGKISSLAARALVRAGLRCVMVANRTFERAQKLASDLNGEAIHFDALDDVLKRADIVICSTGAPHIVLHAETVEKAQRARAGRPLLIADLAVPRDADPRIASIPNVQLTNIDDLDAVVKISCPLTASVCRAVERIVREELEGFCAWETARRCAPVIQSLHEKAKAICRDEVNQTLKRLAPLTAQQRQLVEALGQKIVGKLLHEPTACLREHADDQAYIEVVQNLYGIQ